MRRTVGVGLSSVLVAVGSLVLAESTPSGKELNQLAIGTPFEKELYRLPTVITPEILADSALSGKVLYRIPTVIAPGILANSPPSGVRHPMILISPGVLPECPVGGPGGFFYRYDDAPEALKNQRIELCWTNAVMPQPAPDNMEKSTQPR